jgi:hypothetical protein
MRTCVLLFDMPIHCGGDVHAAAVRLDAIAVLVGLSLCTLAAWQSLHIAQDDAAVFGTLFVSENPNVWAFGSFLGLDCAGVAW